MLISFITMKTTYLSKFWFITSFLQINVSKEKLLIDSFSLLPCLFVLYRMLFESVVEIKIKIKSRLHCIDIYDDDCMSTLYKLRVALKPCLHSL